MVPTCVGDREKRSVALRHVRHQGRVLAALARGAVAVIRGPRSMAEPVTPGPWVRATLAPRSDDLIAAYVQHVGGDPAAYRDHVPPHLFPQWMFPLQARALEGVPYPMQKVLNAGCRLEVKGRLPQGEPLVAATRLLDIDDDGHRALLRFVATTGTKAEPEIVVATLRVIVPLRRKSSAKKKHRPRVASDAQELDRWHLSSSAGLDFAKLTGDFNPVHWVRPYARAFGFANVILQGFSTMARVWEGLSARHLTPRMLDVRFTRPLVLPNDVGLYRSGASVWVGDAPGGPAFVEGTYS